MRKIAFIIAIIGLFILLFLAFFQTPKKIDSPEKLNSLEKNERVFIEGKVASLKHTKNSIILYLETKNITIVCDKSCEDVNKKEIYVEGIIEEFKGKKQIKALKIKKKK